MKEIKVYKYANENDCYVELWREVGTENYYGRYTYMDAGIWYSVCDPLGYCELNTTIKDDVVFVLCDAEGNEYMRYGNGDENPLPKFETYMYKKWDECKDAIEHNVENLTRNFWAECFNGDTTMKINQWLLSFKDDKLYPDEIKKMYGYDENWTGCWYEHEIGYEPIKGTEFTYLGKKYQFTKVKHKHDVCGVEWYEFVCTDSPYQLSDWANEDRPWIVTYGYLGNWFDDNTYGTMYDKRTAREMVIKALESVIPREKSYQKLLYVQPRKSFKCYDRDTCTELGYADAADALINRDLHRENIESICEHIRDVVKDKIFASNRDNKIKITAMYPDIFGYDWCLI